MNHDQPATFCILGASGGIGAALAARLARPGATLVLAARREAPLEALAERVRSAGAEAIVRTLDASQPSEVEACIEHAASARGRLDGVANCVGSIILKPAHQTSDDELERTLRLNLWSAFACVRGAARAMRSSGGSVVLMASAAAVAGLPNHEAIAAAKGGVIALARSAAATYASQSIRVNCVAPGLVATPMASAITGNEASLRASIAMHPLGRIGTPEDVAPALAWLLSPESAWVTGQTIGVDGGLALVRPRMKA